MNKKQFIVLLVLAVVIVWVADLLAGNYLSAKLATSQFARKFNLFNPQAPIVVSNENTVRVNTDKDPVQTAENSKSKVATIVYFENNQLMVSGSAVNWTSDGYFVTVKQALGLKDKFYAVMTNSGDLYPIEKSFIDPASNLVILQTSAQNLPVLDPANAKDLRVGEQVVTLLNSLGNEQTTFFTGYVSKSATDHSGLVYESDLVSGGVYLQTGDTALGSAVINLSGRLVGIWDGTKVVETTDVRLLVNSFLSNEKVITRPSYGFSYQILSTSEAKALQTVSGARIMGIATGKVAASIGLKVGDVITEIDNKVVNSETDLDNILRTFRPGDSVNIVVNRQGTIQNYSLKVGTLK